MNSKSGNDCDRHMRPQAETDTKVYLAGQDFARHWWAGSLPVQKEQVVRKWPSWLHCRGNMEFPFSGVNRTWPNSSFSVLGLLMVSWRVLDLHSSWLRGLDRLVKEAYYWKGDAVKKWAKHEIKYIYMQILWNYKHCVITVQTLVIKMLSMGVMLDVLTDILRCFDINVHIIDIVSLQQSPDLERDWK